MVKRAIWVVNHKTLMPAEVPILQSLGYEVYVPKLVPNDPGYRSALIDFSLDAFLTIPQNVVEALNAHKFYEQKWNESMKFIINKYFDVFITSVSGYTTPLFEAVSFFDGVIVARIFGREKPHNYTSFFKKEKALKKKLMSMKDRFIFGQAFENLSEVEDAFLQERSHTITVPMPDAFWAHQSTWSGRETDCLFLCPNILDNGYYSNYYNIIKSEFGDLEHKIFGKQTIQPDDSSVLNYLTEAQLFEKYAKSRVFAYLSDEERHVHYSPLEAMIVGTPVLYMKGSLLNALAERGSEACCDNYEDMKIKILAIQDEDVDLIASIKRSQAPILEKFSKELCASQWRTALNYVQA